MSVIRNPALRAYYPAQPTSSVNNDPTSLDSKAFDSNRYFKNLLQSKKFEELRITDSELRSEIKALDGNMKTLVHNNYKKFIIAADTINQMNKNIEGMEGEMQHLQENTEKIEKCSTLIAEHLDPKRREIEQLSGVHQLLQQLQFLAEVPTRLDNSLKTGNYADGIEYYNKTAAILNRYSYLPSFNTIKQNSERLLVLVKAQIFQKYEDTEIEVEQAYKYCVLLRALNVEDEKLRTIFYKTRFAKITTTLEKWKNFTVNPASPDEQKSVSYKRALSNLNTEFFPLLANFVKAYQKLFVYDEGGPEEYEVSVLNIFKIYNETVSFQLIKSESPEVMSACLDHVAIEFRAAHGEYMIPKMDLSARAKLVISTITDYLVNYYFDSFVNNFISTLAAVATQVEEEDTKSSPTPDFFHSIVLNTEAEFNNELEQLFEKLQPLIVEMIGQYPKLPEYISSSLTQAITSLNDHVLSVRISDKPTSGRSHQVVLCNIWLRLSQSGILTFTRRIKGLGESISINNTLFNTNKIEQGTREIKESTRETAMQLLQYFVRVEGEKLGMLVRRYIETTSWMSRREPRYVDEVIVDTLLDELTSLKNYFQLIFTVPDDDKHVPTKRPAQGLFPNKMQLFSRIEFERGSVLSAIFKVCLKTFLECVRLVTFGNFGYQQIQVNVHYMRLFLIQNNLVDDKTPVLEMLDEIVTSAEERTVESVPMETFLIERICQDKLRNPKDS